MDLHNYTEDIVNEVLEDLISERTGICTCKKCMLDMAAVALNNLPAKYVVTEKGRVYAKLAEAKLQLKVDILKEVTKAIDIVKNNPKH